MSDHQNSMSAQNSFYSKPKFVGGSKTLRKVRVICYDPDLTDSSSDDESVSMGKTSSVSKKRIVQEINLPVSIAETESSCKDSSNRAKNSRKRKGLDKLDSRKPSSSEYSGVMQRKWAAEIPDPMQGVRVWLGTCNTAEEASMTYEHKRLEFQALVAEKSQNASCSAAGTGNGTGTVLQSQNSAVSVDSESVISHSSASVLEIDNSVSQIDPCSSALGMFLGKTQCVVESVVKESVAEVKESDNAPVMSSIEKEFPRREIGQGFDLQAELNSSLMFNDFGDLFADFDAFEGLEVRGFDSLEPNDLLAFEFEFDFDFNFDLANEEFAWTEEPRNVAVAAAAQPLSFVASN